MKKKRSDGIPRRVRNDMYGGQSAEQYWRTLDWIYTAPDYVREFRDRR